MRKYINSPEPALHTDRAASYQRAIDFRYRRYADKLQAAQARRITLALALVFVSVVIWLLSEAAQYIQP